MYNKQLIGLAKYFKMYKYDIAIVMIAIICVSATLLSLGQIVRQLIDAGVVAGYTSSINQSILLICLLISIFGVSSFFRSYYINMVAEKITNKIRTDVITNLLKLELNYFEDSKTGNIISCLTSDIELIARLIIDSLSFAVRNSLMLIGSIGLMFFHSPKLSLIVLGIVPMLLVPIIRLGRYLRILSKSSLELQGSIVSNLHENFTNIRTIYAFNQQSNKINIFTAQINDYLQQASTRLKIRAAFFAVSISIILISISCVIWVGSNDIITGDISSGEMMSFIYYAIIAGMSAGGIAEFSGESQKPIAATERVFELMNLKPEPAYSDSDDGSFYQSSDIEFVNVNFSYPNRPQVQILDNLSFKIGVGKFIGIVGKSGTGKSTIMQLLLKFYLPLNGQIFIGNQDIAVSDTAKIRKLIAYVPQEPSIFSGTIKDNIAFSKPESDIDEIKQAAEIAGVMDFIKDFPDGFNTYVGEKGVRLSGGQKQRIAIARAIVYKPDILLLDEATSALDSESEQLFFVKLQDIMQGKTIISIAHRISTIENADEILLIDKGKLSVKGTHSELLTNSKLYRILCEEQAINL